MQYAIHLGYALVSIFPRSSDHPLQDILSLLSKEGQADQDVLHFLIHASDGQTTPSTVDGSLTRATAYALLGDVDLARKQLLPLSHTSGEGGVMALILLGLLEAAHEQYQEAYMHLEEAWQACQQHQERSTHIAPPALAWVMATTLIKLLRVRDAYTLLTDALAMDVGIMYQPVRADLHAQRGVVLSMLGCQYRGLLDLHQAIALDPDNIRLYKIRGILHMELACWEAAYHDLWRAACHDPGDQYCADALARVLHLLHASAPRSE